MPPGPPTTSVLIPVKSFRAAKGRLASALRPDQRAALAVELATRVVRAAAPLPVAIVCDDDAVAAWASAQGAEVLWRPGQGLNQAVADGVAALAEQGYRRVIVAHGDLLTATALAWTARFVGVTIVPDRHDDGTNVLSVPTNVGFRFAYGVGSFRRHAAETRRVGLGLRVVRDAGLGWDIDVPSDIPAGLVLPGEAVLDGVGPIGAPPGASRPGGQEGTPGSDGWSTSGAQPPR